MKLHKYIEYIKEEYEEDYFNFTIGEIVSVVGVVDDREFHGVKSRILEIDKTMYQMV